MEPSQPRVTFAQVLKNQQFFALWLAQFVSNFGDWLAGLALFSLVTYRWHGTPYQVAGIFVCFALPFALLGPVAGVFVDRWSLKWTMIASDLVRAVLALALVFAGNLPQVYALFLGLSAVSCFFMPAQNAAIPLLVRKEELLVANAVNQQTIHFNKIVSPAIAGLLVAWAGEKVCFYLDSFSFLFSAAMLSRLMLAASPAASGRDARSVLEDMRAGLRFLWQQHGLRFVTLAMVTTMLAAGAFDALIAVYVRDILHAGSRVFGALVALVGAGTVVGALLIGKFAQRQPRASLVVYGIFGLGVGVSLLAASYSVPVALLWSLALGLAVSSVMLPAQTLLQEDTPHGLRGRVGSTSLALMTVSQLVGVSIAGKIANWIGIRKLYQLVALLLASIAALGYAYVRAYRLGEAQPHPADH